MFDCLFDLQANLIIRYTTQCIREIQGIKQEAFGQLCRNRYSQQRISDFENMVALDESLLDELATALGVTPDFVKSFKDENVIYHIQNNSNSTFNDNSIDPNTQPTFIYDGSDKLVALLENLLRKTVSNTIYLRTQQGCPQSCCRGQEIEGRKVKTV